MSTPLIFMLILFVSLWLGAGVMTVFKLLGKKGKSKIK